ncbi:MAG: hypothetical protein IZT55_01425 [Anaerolineae bacterium]|nr:hypothetical protein [Anaerolineae bacterium]
MLDDLREQSKEFDYLGEESDVFKFDTDHYADTQKPKWLGMTPVQRFVIALMLLMMTCILSTFCLLLTERISLPFF